MKLSNLIDTLNERVGYLANWAVLLSCLISAGNAMVRYAFDMPARKGMIEFARRAAAIGLAPPFEPRYFEDPRPRLGVALDDILEEASRGRRLSLAEAERLVEQAPLIRAAS